MAAGVCAAPGRHWAGSSMAGTAQCYGEVGAAGEVRQRVEAFTSPEQNLCLVLFLPVIFGTDAK